MDFAAHLKRMLDERKLSLREFARRTGRSAGFIHGVVHRKIGPPDDLAPWAEVLELQSNERDAFMLGGALARSPQLVRDHVAELERRLARGGTKKTRRAEKADK